MDDEFLDSLRGQGKLAYHRITQHAVAVAYGGCAAAAIFFQQCYYSAFDRHPELVRELLTGPVPDRYIEIEEEIFDANHTVLLSPRKGRCEWALRRAQVNGYGGSIIYTWFKKRKDAEEYRKDGSFPSDAGTFGSHVVAYVTDPLSKNKIIIFDPQQQDAIKDFDKPGGIAIAAERSYEKGTFYKLDCIKDEWEEGPLNHLLGRRDLDAASIKDSNEHVVLDFITSIGIPEDRSGVPLNPVSFYTASSRKRMLDFQPPKPTKVKPDEVELVGVEWIKEYRESPKEIAKSLQDLKTSRPYGSKKRTWPEAEIVEYRALQKTLREKREEDELDGLIVLKRKRTLREEPTIKEVPIGPDPEVEEVVPDTKKAKKRKLQRFSDKPLHPLEVGRGRGNGESALGNKAAHYALSEDDIRKVVGNVPIYRYPELENMSSPDQMFKGARAAVLLFLTDNKDTGHWLTVLDQPDHYEVFDSFGVGAWGFLCGVVMSVEMFFEWFEQVLRGDLKRWPGSVQPSSMSPRSTCSLPVKKHFATLLNHISFSHPTRPPRPADCN